MHAITQVKKSRQPQKVRPECINGEPCLFTTLYFSFSVSLPWFLLTFANLFIYIRQGPPGGEGFSHHDALSRYRDDIDIILYLVFSKISLLVKLEFDNISICHTAYFRCFYKFCIRFFTLYK